MPFNFSVMSSAVAESVVADAGGAAADSDMLTRAGRALDATAQRWNRLKWKWTQSEQYINMLAPFTVTGCSVTAGSTNMFTTSDFNNVSASADDLLTADPIRGDTFVSSITNATSLVMTNVATKSTTGLAVVFSRPIFALATNIKQIYDIRLTQNQRPLFYLQRRTYDRLVSDQNGPGAVVGYDLFKEGDLGKIQFVSTPSQADTAHIRYYRRITMPTQSATLDIPQDYEDVFIAASKAYFLADKKETSDRAQYWDRYAREGLAQIRADESYLPDEVLAFEPPHFGVYTYTNPNMSIPWWDNFTG